MHGQGAFYHEQEHAQRVERVGELLAGVVEALWLIQQCAGLYTRVLSGAQQFVATLRAESYESVKQQLVAQQAFTEVSSQLRW